MRAVIVTGGLAPSYPQVKNILTSCDRVYAADSGYDWCKANNISVHALLGDMDSIHTNTTELAATVYRFPKEKDYTDTELAISRARQDGATYITVIGGGGGRLDHLISLLFLFYRKHPPHMWITDNDYVELVTSTWDAVLPVNSRISVFPISQQIVQLSSEGLHWNLDGLNWSIGDAGISNYNDSKIVNITVHTGSIIVVRPLITAMGKYND